MEHGCPDKTPRQRSRPYSRHAPRTPSDRSNILDHPVNRAPAGRPIVNVPISRETPGSPQRARDLPFAGSGARNPRPAARHRSSLDPASRRLRVRRLVTARVTTSRGSVVSASRSGAGAIAGWVPFCLVGEKINGLAQPRHAQVGGGRRRRIRTDDGAIVASGKGPPGANDRRPSREEMPGSSRRCSSAPQPGQLDTLGLTRCRPLDPRGRHHPALVPQRAVDSTAPPRPRRGHSSDSVSSARFVLSSASEMGPVRRWFCQWHRTTRVASRRTTPRSASPVTSTAPASVRSAAATGTDRSPGLPGPLSRPRGRQWARSSHPSAVLPGPRPPDSRLPSLRLQGVAP